MSKNYEHNTAFDDLYVQVASRVSGIDELLHTFFGFLHRKTDFYVEVPTGKKCKMGFHPGEAESMLRNAFTKYSMKSPPYSELVNAGATGTTPSKKPVSTPSEASASKKDPVSSPPPRALTPPKSAQKAISSFEAAAVAADVPSTPTPAASMTPIKPRYTDDGKQIPIGNGGYADEYYWTQTLNDLTIYIDVPHGTKSKDIKCAIQPTSISVELVGAAAAAAATARGAGVSTSGRNGGSQKLIEGAFEDPVKMDDCMWTLSSASSSSASATPSSTPLKGPAAASPGGGGVTAGPPPAVIIITLDKTRQTWWRSAVVGGPEIDTTKVDSTQNIGDYDDTTQAAIRKIMFEQKQQRLGLPLPKDSVLSPQVPSLDKLPPLPFGDDDPEQEQERDGDR